MSTRVLELPAFVGDQFEQGFLRVGEFLEALFHQHGFEFREIHLLVDLIQDPLAWAVGRWSA